MAERDPYKITAETYNRIAKLYRDTFMDLDLYNDTYDVFCELIEKRNAEILEIGCGPGNITRYIGNKRPGFVIDAIDVAPDMIGLARESNPGVSFMLMDCRHIGQLSKRYDGIMCGFCIPYLSKEDCRKLIKDSSVLLNRGGILYLSFIGGNYSHSGFETGKHGTVYLYYHEQDNLVALLEEQHFEVDRVMEVAYPRAGKSEIHTVLIAKFKG